MKKHLSILFTALALALGAAPVFAVDAANDVVISQRNPTNTGFIQRNVGAAGAITNVATFRSQLGIAPLASPTFTGTVTIPTPFTLGAVSVTTTGTELNYVGGVTSAIQTQLNAKQATITFGTGVQSALGNNIGSAGAPVLFNGALGTPSSGTVTNLTGTASININGTVGATTRDTGAFTRLGVNVAAPSGEIYGHFQKGSAGTAPTWLGPDVVIIENTAGTTAALQLFSSTVSAIGFSKPSSRNPGSLFYTHATDTLTISAGGATSATFASTGVTFPGNITQSAGSVYSVASGTNRRAGNATLVGGTITVSNTTVTANTIVMLTRKTSGGTIGTAITYTLSAGTSFTITSDSALDTSTFSYFLIENP